MKYIKLYNESLKDVLKGKTDDELLKSLSGIDDITQNNLKQSIIHDYLNGVKTIIENAIKYKKMYLLYYIIKMRIFSASPEIVEYLLSVDDIKEKFKPNQIYLLEKYKLGLHLKEERDYEKWFKKVLKNLKTQPSDAYKNVINYFDINNDIYAKYYLNEKCFYLFYKKTWKIFEEEYQLDYDSTELFVKDMIIKILDLPDLKSLSSII